MTIDPARDLSAESSLADSLRAVLHELRGRVGSVRLAVTALLEDETNDGYRASLLRTANEETRRISTDITAVAALAACLADRSPRDVIDAAAAIDRAAAQAGRLGTKARLDGPATLRFAARAGTLDDALASLIQLAADVDGEVAATAGPGKGTVMVRLARADGSPVKLEGSLADRLVEAIGARRIPDETALAFEFPEATE